MYCTLYCTDRAHAPTCGGVLVARPRETNVFHLQTLNLHHLLCFENTGQQQVHNMQVRRSALAEVGEHLTPEEVEDNEARCSAIEEAQRSRESANGVLVVGAVEPSENGLSPALCKLKWCLGGCGFCVAGVYVGGLQYWLDPSLKGTHWRRPGRRPYPRSMRKERNSSTNNGPGSVMA